MTSYDFVIPLNEAIPKSLSIAYYVLCGLGGIIAFSSFIVQFTKPANYGKFDGKTEGGDQKQNHQATAEEKLVQRDGDENAASGGGCRIPQRVAHICSDFPPGVILFAVLFFTAFQSNEKRSDPSYVMLACWLAHYIHRGLITPLTMRYSSTSVDLGICLGGFFPNCIFSAAISLHISVTNYSLSSNLAEKKNYFEDARFIIGIILFVVGYAMNRWSDWHLRSLREENISVGADGKEVRKYVLPNAGLFKLCFCPNYFGEFVEWCGFAILTSSLAGVIWAIFGLSTFLPRSLVTKKWYLEKFSDADKGKAALIPFLV